MPDLEYPRPFHTADRRSIAAQNQHVWFVRTDLMAIVLAAALGAIGSLFSRPASTVVYIVSVLFLTVALVAEIIAERRSPEDDWYDGRAGRCGIDQNIVVEIRHASGTLR